jgi:hypothetical protein
MTKVHVFLPTNSGPHEFDSLTFNGGIHSLACIWASVGFPGERDLQKAAGSCVWCLAPKID